MTAYQEVFIMEPAIDFEQWWELAEPAIPRME